MEEYKDLRIHSCSICGQSLDERQKQMFMSAKMPPLCDIHLIELKEKLKKCTPLFSKIKL
jgi:hypothetical protein